MSTGKRRMWMVVAAVMAIGLVGAACSSTTTNSTTGGTAGGGGGTTPGGSSLPAMDYSTLKGSLKGSGSSFQQQFVATVIDAFAEQAPDLTIEYGGGGSGKGKQELLDKVVDFAGTDSLVKDEDKAKYAGGGVLYFPIAAAPITVSYNLKGVDKLQLSPSTLAKIMQADIKTWDDAAIKADNPGTTLPSTPIVVVHRSDGSGTTSTFTKYLKAAAASDWKLDAGDTVNWPANTQAGNGNGGVAQAIKGADGAIGYVDFADAKTSGLSFAAIKNKAGKFVTPSIESAQAAVAKANVKDDLTFAALDVDGDAAYPITASTYTLTNKSYSDKTKAENLKGFLRFTLTQGQDLAAGVDFAKLPADLQAKTLAQIDKIQVG